MDKVALAFEFLLRIAPKIYEFIKDEIDGGADAEKFRKEPVTVYIAYGGKEGEAVKVQRLVESDMLDPNAE
jgi:hypothetical protein